MKHMKYVCVYRVRKWERHCADKILRNEIVIRSAIIYSVLYRVESTEPLGYKNKYLTKTSYNLTSHHVVRIPSEQNPKKKEKACTTVTPVSTAVSYKCVRQS